MDRSALIRNASVEGTVEARGGAPTPGSASSPPRRSTRSRQMPAKLEDYDCSETMMFFRTKKYVTLLKIIL